MDDNNADNIFTLEKKGSKWLIFDNYVFDIKPAYITLNTNIKGAQIFKDDKLVADSNSSNFTKEIGPYVPGDYKLKAVYKGKYCNLEKSTEVDLVKSARTGQNKSTVNLDLDGHYINVSVPNECEDAKIFINGIDTKILAKNANEIGPLTDDTRIYAVKNVSGKELKTQEQIVGNASDVYLEFPGGINEESSSYTKPVFNTITASSELAESNITHHPQNVVDGDKSTAWVEGSSGDGVGEWIKLESNTEQTVSGFSIINGYTKSNYLYYANNRVAKVLVEYSDGTNFTFNLEDKNLDEQGTTFENIKKTKYIKFTILGVYKGSKYNDTCLSEIRVF